VAYDLNYREHSAYAALVKNRAVCQGYALLLYKMLNKAGVETRLISGKAGGENHLWNLVNLGGNWYHIDATWNDPVPDVPGRVRYDYYNRSDAQMAPTHSWDRDLYPAALTPYPYPVN
jgi:transglutaminase/protease-like cytokinesis protein 3